MAEIGILKLSYACDFLFIQPVKCKKSDNEWNKIYNL
jgi:hypothetical protein